MSHDHSHHTGNYNRAFAVGILLNLIFVAIEAGYGVAAGSLALIADAGHNLSDVLSLSLAWGASWLATKPATGKRTYGFRKATIMASLTNAIVLLFALGGIAWEAVGRIFDPGPVEAITIIVVAAIGVVVNAITAWLFVSGQKEDLNIKGAYLHMAADTGVSLGVVIAGVFVMLTGWQLIDPLISIFIVAVILVGTWSLLRDSLNLALDSVPKDIDIEKVENYLNGLEHVYQIHDLHIWAMSTTEVALSVHLVTTEEALGNNYLSRVQQKLHDHFGIEHSTIQIEKKDTESCMLNNDICKKGLTR
ncbi:MAG: cation diffusion facilitator family transporter [Candidatus Electrothrix sp. Rat3]|nr:cation diffusion facilitator family transporter [Candidatus Electrothrix rattekaaiensis]